MVRDDYGKPGGEQGAAGHPDRDLAAGGGRQQATGGQRQQRERREHPRVAAALVDPPADRQADRGEQDHTQPHHTD